MTSEKPADNAAERGESPAGAGGVLGWAQTHPAKAALVLTAVLISASASMLGIVLLARRVQPKPPPSLAAAFAAFDEHRYTDARALAEEYATEAPNDKGGGVDFIRGAVTAHEAERGQSAEKQRYFLLAAKYLQESQTRGFPLKREAEARYLLAKCLFASGQNTASRPILREALAEAQEHRAELHLLLAESLRCDAAPDLPAALKENQAARTEAKSDPALLRRALLQQAQLQVAAGKTADAEATLKSLGAAPDAAAALIRAQIRMVEAQAATGPDREKTIKTQCAAALKFIEQAQEINPDDVDITRQAMYLRGLCLAESDASAEAIEQFRRTEQLFRRSPEGWAAGVRAAELLLAAQRPEEALQAYRRALIAVAAAQTYHSPWMSLADFRRHVLAYYQRAVDRHEFATAIALCNELSGAFPPDRALELTAETYRNWGRTVLREAQGLAPTKAEAPLREGRLRLREAAAAYQRLAKLMMANRRYADLLWESIQLSLEGHDYELAVTVLAEYLKNENRRRQPDAMVAMGDAHLALGQFDEAFQAYSECVKVHPQDAAAFRARLGAARACVEKNLPARAEEYLRDNLRADLLTPASAEWRESLFDLGQLLFNEQRLGEAIARLEEAVERYPDAARMPESLYLLAEAKRHLARGVRTSLSQLTVEHTRLERSKQMHSALEESLTEFRRVRDTLQQTQQARGLTRAQDALLRNAWFAVADVLAELGQADEAITAYRTAAKRYENSPEALEAYAQIARLQRDTNRPAEARGTLEQAKLLLRRMRADAPFTQTTNHDRNGWQALLDKMKDEG